MHAGYAPGHCTAYILVQMPAVCKAVMGGAPGAVLHKLIDDDDVAAYQHVCSRQEAQQRCANARLLGMHVAGNMTTSHLPLPR